MKRRLRAGPAALLGLMLALGPAGAIEPRELLHDPSLEARARAISAELRCLVCQNQSIDDSDAPLAHDLRVLVREKLVAGESDATICSDLARRYGEFVLLRPVFAPHTLLLWLGPAILLGIAGLAVARSARRSPPATAALRSDEESRLGEILAADETRA